MTPRLFIASACVAALLAGCSVGRVPEPVARPSDAEIEAQVRRDVDRMLTLEEGVAVEGLETNPAGTVACGFLRTPGQPRLVILSRDDDFSDDRRRTAFGVVSRAADFGSAANQSIARSWLGICRDAGLLADTPDGPVEP